jgi:DNA helicase IV
MAWRLLMRRCPTKSMTLVGDIAQTGSAAGASSWASVLAPHVDDRWRLAELTVNYRTPAQVMRLASAMLTSAGVAVSVPRSVREGDFPPVVQRIGDDAALRSGVRDELELLGDGKLAVLASPSVVDQVFATLTEEFGDVVARGPLALDASVAVLSVREAKGLEFDAVVLVEPSAIFAESTRGANDLYVALTRPTQRLRVLYRETLPPGLES